VNKLFEFRNYSVIASFWPPPLPLFSGVTISIRDAVQECIKMLITWIIAKVKLASSVNVFFFTFLNTNTNTLADQRNEDNYSGWAALNKVQFIRFTVL
jgi:hypothetical protein